MKTTKYLMIFIGFLMLGTTSLLAEETPGASGRQPDAFQTIGLGYQGVRLTEKTEAGNEYNYTFHGMSAYLINGFPMNKNLLFQMLLSGTLLLGNQYQQTVSGATSTGSLDMSLYNGFTGNFGMGLEFVFYRSEPFELSITPALEVQTLILLEKDRDYDSNLVEVSEMWFPLSLSLQGQYHFNDKVALKSSLAASYSLFFLKVSDYLQSGDLSALSWRFNLGLSFARFRRR